MATFVHLLAWLYLAFVGLVTISQAIGWSGTTELAIIQSLTPYLAALLAPVIAAALWRRRLLMVTVASAIGFGLALLATPVGVPEPSLPAAAGSTGLQVASLNLWHRNDRIDEVERELAELDADVIVFTEFTRSHKRALETSALAESYPHRTARTGRGATGIAVWSRWPLHRGDMLDTFNDSLDVGVAGPDGDVDLVAMHMPTPLVDLDAWQRDLATAAAVGRMADGPTLLIGDLNASYWHPSFRRLLDVGFVDAHTAAGSGFSTSWPTDWWIPPFVRLDHALTIGGLVSTEIADFEIPGSDHRGLMVTVAPTR
jgi:endonuclease/exonuclease/phosphatase (EEP) superfamily protein YafD